MAGDGGHLENGDLIRLLDRECSSEEEERIKRHLRDCVACRQNAAELERLSHLFGLALQRGDVTGDTSAAETRPLRRRWPRKRMLQAAAILLIVAAAASPARAWLVEGWLALRSLFTEAPAPVQPEREPSIGVAETTAVVTFAAVGSDFSLEVVSAQSRGTVVIASGSVPSASARVLGGDGSEELVVLPGGLRILNVATSTASYEIVLPPVVRNIEVRIGGRTVWRLDETALSGPIRQEFELAPPEPNR
jgi:anti-sigma factor RsiW